jgi:hypothetical protein
VTETVFTRPGLRPPAVDYEVAADDLRILGTFRGVPYATLPDGREVRVERDVQTWNSADTLPAGAVLIATREPVEALGRMGPDGRRRPPATRVRYRLAMMVRAGTYAALAASEAAREARRTAEATPRRVNRLTLVPTVPRRVTDAASLRTWLAERGTVLERLPSGRLDVRTVHPITAHLDLVAEFAALLAAEVGGPPVACEFAHDSRVPAVTLTAGGNVPTCADHLRP